MSQTAFCIVVAIIYLVVGAPFIIDNVAVMIEGIKEKKARKAEAEAQKNTEAQQNGRRA